jgi:cytochrome d ubiquinol oxidase subunit I
VTTAGNLWLFFGATVLLYVVVGAATVYVLRLMRRHWQEAGGIGDEDVPYGPRADRDAAVPAGDAA